MSHHGDPDDEEVIVVEEPDKPEKGPAIVIKAPRMPTQAEVEAHEATHLPHEDWCDVCARGRGRNKPHRRKKRRRGAQERSEERARGAASEAALAEARGASDDASHKPGDREIPGLICSGKTPRLT